MTKVVVDLSAKGGELKTFILTEDVKVLESITSKFKGNSGGGKQYFSTSLKGKIKTK
jgi:hypothetical protein